MAQRHRVNTPRLNQADPNALWRAATFLEEIVLLRPLPARNELYGYGVAIVCLQASGERIDTKIKLWSTWSMTSGAWFWTPVASPTDCVRGGHRRDGPAGSRTPDADHGSFSDPGNTVSAIDARTRAVVFVVKVDDGPGSVAIAHDGSRACCIVNSRAVTRHPAARCP
ncbi:hypothetical protein [Streptantibioticus ferralitis]|uniref:hypothetical protein n=1 Tax=Streptantibioticus ferralitis TaxID=236510 RepID=UPI0027E38878|nr:hypothetical protein [Streptantibioticus ferralitis]